MNEKQRAKKMKDIPPVVDKRWELLKDTKEVVPLNDSGEHLYGQECPCNPTLVHNAYDHRETYERSE